MKKNRILVGAVLTAGLGLTGVVAASASGATTPDSAAPKSPAVSVGSAGSVASVTSVFPGRAGGAPVLTQKGRPGRGPVVVCSVIRAPGAGEAGKPGAGLPLPKPGQRPERITIKVVNGKVYLNGKLVPGARMGKDCPSRPPSRRCPAGRPASPASPASPARAERPAGAAG